jgi:hypothetical protein
MVHLRPSAYFFFIIIKHRHTFGAYLYGLLMCPCYKIKIEDSMLVMLYKNLFQYNRNIQKESLYFLTVKAVAAILFILLSTSSGNSNIIIITPTTTATINLT